ncbi:MAG TPA: IPT/TIG domain-containing protein [Acidiferrobacterales bacterium]|nr:IPT/TIG domain-containing protein [Acidiferrobacterales bacterium]
MARKKKKKFNVKGQVIDRNTRAGIPDLRVEAWDEELIFDDSVGSAVTDKNGSFQISFDESYFREIFPHRRPDLFFKVFRESELIKSTEDSVLWDVDAADIEVTIEVDAEAADEQKTFTVRGQVARKKQQGITAVPTAPLASLGGANLDGTILDNLKAGSPAKTFIDNTLNAALKANLITAATGAKQSALVNLLQAMPAVDIAANKDFSLRDFVSKTVKLPTDPKTKAAVQAAIAQISSQTTVSDLLGLNTNLKDSPLFTPEVQRADLGALLGTSPNPKLTDPQLQNDFINSYANFKGTIQDFWSQLAKDTNFTDLVHEIQFTFQLGVVTKNNPPLVKALRTQPQFQPNSPRDLTKVSADDWTQLITSQNIPVPDSIPGATPGEKTSNYVNGILGILKAAFPTDYIAQSLTQTPRDDIDGQVAQFLKSSPDFSFITTNLQQYLSKNPNALNAIPPTDKDKVTARINGYQRLTRLNSDPQVVTTLMGKGLDSAYKISSIPRNAFLQQHTQSLGNSAKAQAIYATAQRTTASTLNFYTTIREGLSNSHPWVFGDVTKEVSAAVQQIPNWEELFGPTSSCACKDCRSVLSAAAYFVDLLHFLSKAHIDPSNPNSVTLLDMIQRRPDLVNIKLNCENTNTTLPYLDLVNEILESVVATHFGDPPLPSAHNTPADATSDQLSVNPEFTNDAAYIPLANAFYPFTLPFDRFLSIARTYLEFAGSSLYEVMKTFQIGVDPAVPANSNPTPAPSDQTIALEYLKISANEFLILTGQSFQGTSPQTDPVDLSEYYGYKPNFGNTATIMASPLGATRKSNIVTIATSGTHAFVAGQDVTVSGVADSSFDGTFVITAVPSTTTFSYAQTAVDATSGDGTASSAWYSVIASPIGAIRKSNAVTITTSSAHAFVVGQVVAISGVTDSSFNGTFLITAVPSPTTFSYGQTNADASSSGGTATAWWYTDIASVPNFLQRIDISFQDLIYLIETHFLNSAQSITLQVDPQDPCNIQSTIIANLAPADASGNVDYTALKKIYRFIRLYKKLGWNISDLDKTIAAIGATDIDAPFLLKLSQVKQLQDKLNLTSLEVLGFWANIDTEGADSLYLSLFQNKGTLNPLDPCFTLRYTAALPSNSTLNLSFLNAYGAQISYIGGQLQFSDVNGNPMPMTANQERFLLSLSTDPNYRQAVVQLFLQNPAQLPSLPTGFTLPTQLPDAIYYQGNQMFFIGQMSDDLRTQLKALSADPNYQLAIDNLYDMRWAPGTDTVLATQPNQNQTVISHADTILAALRISAPDLTAIVTFLWGALPASALEPNLANLSALYRYARMARVLGVSVQDLISLIQLTGINPFPSWSDTQIVVTVPSGATTGNVVVTVGGTASNGVAFTVGTTPVISAVSPPAGLAGASVTITGANFGATQSTSTVMFNGTPASAASWSDTQITVTVPGGVTTSNVVVTVAGTASNGVAFTVGTTPVISAVSPPAGLAGASVTITGANFGATQGTSTVMFNGTPAPATSWSDTQIMVTVPSGATTGNVVVTVGGTGSNGIPFTVGKIPVISSLFPLAGVAGTPVTITGANFGAALGTSTITFNGTSTAPATPDNTVQFVNKVQEVLQSNFSVAQLNYIYRNCSDPSAGLGPQRSDLDQFVMSLQSSLSTQASEKSPASDPTGVLLKRYLETVLEHSDVLATMELIGGTASYSASLAKLPSITFPPLLNTLIKFDPIHTQLTFTGPMSQGQEAQLLALSDDSAYRTAIQNLFQQSAPAWTTPYKSSPPSPGLLPSIAFPAAFGGLIAIDPTNSFITFTGPMSADQETQLLALSSDRNYQAAIQYLFLLSAPAWSVTYTYAPFSTLPPITLPSLSGGSIAYDQTNARLTLTGTMSDADEARLLGLSTDSSYQAAIESLYMQPRQFLVNKLFFLDTKSVIAKLINDPTASLADKYGFVLNALLNFISLVVQALSSALKLDVALVRLLLVGGQSSSAAALLASTIDPNLAAIADFFALLGNGLSASYFSSPGFGGSAQPITVEPTIDFNWGPTSVPLPGLDSNLLSAKWTGQVVGQFSETYTFYVRIVTSQQATSSFANPPVSLSLWIGGSSLPLTPSQAGGSGTGSSGSAPVPAGTVTTNEAVVSWVSGQNFDTGWAGATIYIKGVPYTIQSVGSSTSLTLASSAGVQGSGVQYYVTGLPVEYTATTDLRAGELIQIELDYPNAPGSTVTALKLSWSSLSTPKSVIPQRQLYASSTFSFDGPLATYKLLWRIALLVNTLRMTLDDVLYLSNNKAAFAGVDPNDPAKTAPFDLNALPVNTSTYPPALFNQWERLLALVGLRDSLPGGDSGLLGIFAAAGSSPAPSGAALIMPISAATGWDASELAVLLGSQNDPLTAGTIGFGLTAGDFVDERWLIRLRSCFALATRFAVSSKHMFEWASLGSNPVTEPNVARDIQAAIKATYDDATWLKVGKSLNDKLRESSRDALVGYILANSDRWELNTSITTPEELYEYFLIDVEMGSCMQTSRIVQASAAIQLFVQRVLINLEPDISPSAVDVRIWKWMKNYRVWQANREVFLYPENWIEPTLRDDKTPFFKELETELQQNPVTPDTVEQAFLNYLEKLDQIARLDVRGIYWQNDPRSTRFPDGTLDSSNDVLHVFARRPSTPNVYYYRQLLNASYYGRNNSPSVWTPWETVTADIQGNHLLPVVWNGHPYIFWPIFTEVAPPALNPPGSSGVRANKVLQLQIAWSRYSEGKWSPKEVSTEYLLPYFINDSTNTYTDVYVGALTQSVFEFSPVHDTMGNFCIAVWTPMWPGTPNFYSPDTYTGNLQMPNGSSFEGVFIFTDCAGKIATNNSTNYYTNFIGPSLKGYGIPYNSTYFDNTLLEVAQRPTSWSDTQIVVTVPSGATTGNVVVTVAGTASNGVAFTVDSMPLANASTPKVSAPVIGGKFSATIDSPSDNATISRGVSFDLSGSASNSSDSGGPVLTVTLGVPGYSYHPVVNVIPSKDDPKDGTWTFNVILNSLGPNTIYASANANGVGTVAPEASIVVDVVDVIVDTAPVIYAVSPSEGPAGALVTITGANFGATQGTSTVMFNGLTPATDPTAGTLWLQFLISGNLYASGEILQVTPSVYRLVSGMPGNGWPGFSIESFDLAAAEAGAPAPVFFYQDDQRTYFVIPIQSDTSVALANPNGALPWYSRESLSATAAAVVGGARTSILARSSSLPVEIATTPAASGQKLVQQEQPQNVGPLDLKFATFWHPHVCGFMETLNQYGVPQLLSLLTQQRTNDGRVISGFALSTSGTHTPGLTGGILYAEGQLYAIPAGSKPSIPAMQAVPSSSFLFWNPDRQFYYDASLTPNRGALIGHVLTDGNSITQVTPGSAWTQPTIFEETYQPTSRVDRPFPEENVDFSFGGAYAIYNWELFFHIPLLIATRLSQNQRFEEAQKWFHYIFNPTTNSMDPVPQRFWNFLPFYECSASDEINSSIEQLLLQLDTPVISAVSPTAGLAGASVTIAGANFGVSQGTSTVTFNGTPAPATSWSDTQIVVTVPSGAATGNVVVTVGGTASNGVAFIVGTGAPVNPQPSECGLDVESQVSQWTTNPFDPFLIARMRTIAFRKTVVMKYLDNLIAWGDYLFSQNTRESINEATQIYVLAQQILGDKPVTIPPQGTIQDYSYNDLVKQGLDDFSNALVALENTFPFSTGTPISAGGGTGAGTLNGVAAQSFYFCIPPNDQLLGYWDTVADRLFKIRHCMNIRGQVEQLPLFAPPISPALLVQAAAAGVDLSSVLNDINVPPPNYRFTFTLQKALELCSELKSLGGALLSALEKNDAEALSLLRATQEKSVLQAVLQIKQSQIDEANKNLAGLLASYAVTQSRQAYYQQLINTGLSGFENTHVSELKEAQTFQGASQIVEIASSVAALIPDFTLGASGMASPVVTARYGGINVSQALAAASRVLGAIASLHTYHANMASTMGGWDRRSQEWTFQLQTATQELTQIQSQIDAATIRVQIAQDELQNQHLQIDNAQAILDFLNSKYTSQKLYSWMVSQVSAIYFQCYQMAYGLAKRAEYCFRFELGLTTSSFIQFGYWDSLRKGLLAGEGLYSDLKRMELAYLDQNQREFEIAKYISLVLFDPLALITLKETGQCFVSLPEAFFDMDYPGHYMRRLKSVSLTIPCVTGPYTSVNCKLTLVSSQIRVDNVANSPQDYTQDSHFITNFAATQSIATSSAQNDSGMFELNFRDERYLPFEGAGVISHWLIELPRDCNVFDFETISDVVINLKYTARDGGDVLRAVAKQAAVLPSPASQSPASQTAVPFPKQNNLVRFFSLRHEFPTEWYKFLNPLSTDTVQTMMLALTKERFPFQYRGKKISISQVDLLLKFKDIYNTQLFKTGTPLGDFGSAGVLNVYLTPSGFGPGQPQAPTQPPPNPIGLKSTPVNFDGTPYGTGPVSPGPGLLWLQVFTTGSYLGSVASTLLDANNHLLPDIIEDIFMVCHYSAA